MRDRLHQILPVAFGTILGWLLLNPPEWLSSLGPLAWLVNGALVALLLVSGVGLVIVSNLPERPTLDPVDEREVHADLRALASRLEALGFRPVGPPCRVNVSPSGILIGFVHAREPIYATAFRTGHLEGKTAFDFVSILHGDRGGLTTGADPGGAALPAGPGELRQVFPRAGVEELFERHREALEHLAQQRIACRAVSADTFRQDFAASIRRQRSRFMRAPLGSTLVTLWRAGTGQVPFVGRLAEQQVARREIARLASS